MMLRKIDLFKLERFCFVAAQQAQIHKICSQPKLQQYCSKWLTLTERMSTSSPTNCQIKHEDNNNNISVTEMILQKKSENDTSNATVIMGKGGFAQAMAKMEGHESFTKLLKKSPFVQMGDPQGKVVEGKIVHIVNDDIYIDFGFKFNCVCPRPPKNGQSYVLGRKVRVLVHDLELSTRFLGSKSDLTILEADCTLLGLAGKIQDEHLHSVES